MPKGGFVSTDEASLALIRKALNIVEPKEDLEELSEEARKEYCAAIAGIWPRLEQDIQHLLYQQLVKTTLQSGTWEEVLVGRGVFGGMELLFEHWQKAAAEHQKDVTETHEETYDEHKVVGEE